MQSILPPNAAATLDSQFRHEFALKPTLHQRKVSNGLTITHRMHVYSVAGIPFVKTGDSVEVEVNLDCYINVFVYARDETGRMIKTECTPIGKDDFGFQIDAKPLALASSSAGPRAGYAAPVYLRDVEYGQHFVFDSELHTLYVLAQFGFGKYSDGQIAVVAIAATAPDGHTQVGRITEHAPLQTVRLVDVLAPLQVRAR
ncbi:MAG: hypothetical protein ABL934_09750 [Lysobacteraceae bacterium]